MVTWQCDKTLKEMQQYLEQQLMEREHVEEQHDSGDDSDSEQDTENEPGTLRTTQRDASELKMV